MKIYLITHAHTEQMPGVAADAWQLSARGVDQAAKLAAAHFWDEVERIVVSSEPKTWLTVERIAHERALPVWIDCRFDELRRGGWTDDYAAQVGAAFSDPKQALPNWEAVESVRTRTLAGVAALRARFGDATLALVAHGICLSTLRAHILGRAYVDFDAWQRLQFGTSACVRVDERGVELVADFELAKSTQR